jgi:hypothetical protein
MIQADDMWDCDDLALRRKFDFSSVWGVSLQGQMRARAMIIFEITS